MFWASVGNEEIGHKGCFQTTVMHSSTPNSWEQLHANDGRTNSACTRGFKVEGLGFGDMGALAIHKGTLNVPKIMDHFMSLTMKAKTCFVTERNLDFNI